MVLCYTDQFLNDMHYFADTVPIFTPLAQTDKYMSLGSLPNTVVLIHLINKNNLMLGA